MTTITVTVKLETVVCVTCGITFAIPNNLMLELERSHARFYCPVGHGLSFSGQSDLEKLQQEADRYKKLWQSESRYAASVVQERNAAQRSLSATKAAHTRTKNRIKNGVCPCCNRHFVNLERHMHGQHPDYNQESE